MPEQLVIVFTLRVLRGAMIRGGIRIAIMNLTLIITSRVGNLWSLVMYFYYEYEHYMLSVTRSELAC